jgi:hypothetical protein
MKKPVNLRNWGPVLAPRVLMLLGVLGSSCSDDGDAAGGAAGMGGSITAGGGTRNLPAGGSAGSGGGATAGSGGVVGNGGTGNGGAAGAAGGSMDGGAGPGPAPEGDAGASNIQHCELTSACLEFRDHAPAPACQESNAANCANLLSGTYAEGPCPAEYVFVEVEETFCGPTASFDLPD